MSEIKNILKELFGDSTIHAVPRIIKSKRVFIKILWSISLLVSTSYCFYLIINSILSYLDFNNNIITRIEKISETPSLFPQVMICNLNMFQTNESFEFINDLIQNKSYIIDFPKDEKKYYFYNELFRQNDSFKQSFSNHLNETLISCLFQNSNCSFADFDYEFHTFFGNCYRFKNKSSYIPGYFYGLRLELFAGNATNVPSFIDNLGFHVFIGNESIRPIHSEGIDISTGTKTNINVKRIFSNRLDLPYNNCTINFENVKSELYLAILKTNRTYRKSDCLNLCYQKQVIDICKCFTNNYDSLGQSNSCTNTSEILCAYEIWKKFGLQEYKLICDDLCPEECNTIIYDLTTSFTNYPSNLYASKYLFDKYALSKGQNWYEDLKQNVLAVNIYYDELGYTLMSQQPKIDLIDLVGIVGGLMGLFVGTSFLSLIEFLEAIIEIFLQFIEKNE